MPKTIKTMNADQTALALALAERDGWKNGARTIHGQVETLSESTLAYRYATFLFSVGLPCTVVDTSRDVAAPGEVVSVSKSGAKVTVSVGRDLIAFTRRGRNGYVSACGLDLRGGVALEGDMGGFVWGRSAV